MNTNLSAPRDAATLDALTGGALTAATSSERAARVRAWLAGDPPADLMQEVYRELAARDKGAARPVRERLEEFKRQREQEASAAEWAERAQALLAQPRMNIADALAWQRDAAKAGAPLSREPLAALRLQLAARARGIEELQHRVQVQRESALLLVQRIEMLSTRPWTEAAAGRDALHTDLSAWLQLASELEADAHWASVDPRFAPQLQSSRIQLQAVWDAFVAALAQAEAAAQDRSAPLPSLPVWAEGIRAARGDQAASVPVPVPVPRSATLAVDPALRAQAEQVVQTALQTLEQEVAQGHGKASAGAANALRQALKDHGRLIDARLEAHAHAAIAAATELEGWQRWSADKVRQALVAQAEALFEVVTPREPKPPKTKEEPSWPHEAATPAPTALPEVAAPDAAVDTQSLSAADAEATARPPVQVAAKAEATAPGAAPPQPLARRPRWGGRKMQETLRDLRERWKQTDQLAPPNHGLWKRFDRACNEAYKVVQVWLDQVKAEAAAHRAQRLALIEEVKAWTLANPDAPDSDWRSFARSIHQFSERWRLAGHLGEKAFAEIQPQWKAAIHAAAAPLEAAQKLSIERRHRLIEEARVLGASVAFRVDAVKSLQQRWQAEAHAVPLDRKHEQKLWDAFRAPIDEAFQRKGAEREKAAAVMNEHDRAVLQASRTLDQATRAGDAAQIRAAMQGLDAALRGARESVVVPGAAAASAATIVGSIAAPVETGSILPGQEMSAPATEAQAPTAPRPVIARRGDDRPGVRRPEAGTIGSMGPSRRDGMGRERDDRRDGWRSAARSAPREDRGPRLGDAAFRAQRDALEHAQQALRKLAAQAHGEALTRLLSAWAERQGDQVPTHQDLGKRMTPAVRNHWAQVVSAPASGDPSQALLRLEMAAEVPTPAQALEARRALQLQLLTRRNDPSPRDTWTRDVAQVLATAAGADSTRRLQAALKVLLRGV